MGKYKSIISIASGVITTLIVFLLPIDLWFSDMVNNLFGITLSPILSIIVAWVLLGLIIVGIIYIVHLTKRLLSKSNQKEV